MAVLLSASRFDEATIPEDANRLVTLGEWWWRPGRRRADGEMLPYGDGRMADLGRLERLLTETDRLPPGSVAAIDHIEGSMRWLDLSWPWVAMRDASDEDREVHRELIVRTLRTAGAIWRLVHELRPDVDWRVYGMFPVGDRVGQRYVSQDPSLDAADWAAKRFLNFGRAGVSLYRSLRQTDEEWQASRVSVLERASASGWPFDVWVTGFGVTGPYRPVRIDAQLSLALGYPAAEDTIYWCDGGRPRYDANGNRMLPSFEPHRRAFEEARSFHEKEVG